MIRLTILITLLLYCNCTVSFAAGHEDEIPQYDIVCAGTGIEGTYLVNTSVYLPKIAKTDDILRKAAIHGVIFKGITGTQGCNSQHPLATNPAVEQEKAAFFNLFFQDGGNYLQYATVVEGSLSVTKTGKKEYRITATLSIQKDLLRKYLEQEKIITGFSDMF